jgi:hypothetical protein
METLVQLRQRTGLALTPHHGMLQTFPHQIALVFDDVRLRGMTPEERQTVLRMLARLLLEARGVATREVGDDNA